MMGGGSSLQAGQKVKVRIARGRVILTIKEGDGGKFECLMKQLLVKGLCIQSWTRSWEAEQPVEPVKESEEAVLEQSDYMENSQTKKTILTFWENLAIYLSFI